MKFNLGQMVVTCGVNDKMADDQDFSTFVSHCIRRHSDGDWGNLSPGDTKENEFALSHQLRLLSAYEKDGLPKIWIITEADRSVTTVLFPDEY